jgi:hypothetical protein
VDSLCGLWRRPRPPACGGAPGAGPRFSVFGDYKLSFATNDAGLKGGGSLETDIWTNHVTFGVSYHFGGAPTVAAPY